MGIAVIFLKSLSFMGPLLIAALSCLMMQRAGVLNLGIDGSMILGGLGYGLIVKKFISLNNSQFIGFTIAFLIGALLGLGHGFLTITLKANQFLTSLIWNYLALALSNIILILNFKQNTLSTNDILVSQIYLVYPLTLLFIFNFILFIGVIIFFNLTKNGLYLKAAGKSDVVLTLSHINVTLLRYVIVTVASSLIGLAGALFVYQKGSFNGTVDGIGLLAFMIVALSQWGIMRTAFFSYLITVLLQLSYEYQKDDMKWWWTIIPYITPLLIAPLFAIFGADERLPKMLNKPYVKETVLENVY